jgi:hypothetical protein
LRLASALVRNTIGPYLERQPPTPLHIVVVGGAGSGKSTVVNFLLGANVAEANPQAGFTGIQSPMRMPTEPTRGPPPSATLARSIACRSPRLRIWMKMSISFAASVRPRAFLFFRISSSGTAPT